MDTINITLGRDRSTGDLLLFGETKSGALSYELLESKYAGDASYLADMIKMFICNKSYDMQSRTAISRSFR